MSFNYLALIQGGLGEDVWDKELQISAVDFQDAANQAYTHAQELHGQVVELQQNDFQQSAVTVIPQPPVEVKDLEKFENECAMNLCGELQMIPSSEAYDCCKKFIKQALTESTALLLRKIDEVMIKCAEHQHTTQEQARQIEELEELVQDFQCASRIGNDGDGITPKMVEDKIESIQKELPVYCSNHSEKEKIQGLAFQKGCPVCSSHAWIKDKQQIQTLQAKIVVMCEALEVCRGCIEDLRKYFSQYDTTKQFLTLALKQIDDALTTDGSELDSPNETLAEATSGKMPDFNSAKLSTSLDLLVKAKEDFKTSLNTIVKLNSGCFPLPYPESEVWKHNTCKGLNETLTLIETFLKENGVTV